MISLHERLVLASCHAVHGPDVLDALDRIAELEELARVHHLVHDHDEAWNKQFQQEITELQAQLEVVSFRPTINLELQAKLDAVKAIIYGSKHADIDKLEQIEAAIGEQE